MKLAIISHTEHYTAPDGTIVGWSPTVNEINHLLAIFDEIYHVAMLYEGVAPQSAMAYTSARIQFVPLKPTGGRGILSKFHTLLQAPSVIRTVSETLKNVDYFQLRTPTGIGVYLIPYLTFFNQHKGWYKYAGNWNQKHPPLGYRLQRFMLKKQGRMVTINGQWPNQPKHCITFENPCLTLEDVAEGNQLIQQKQTKNQWTFCYVGRLESEKGVGRIIDAFKALNVEDKARVDTVHLVGDGVAMDSFQSQAVDCGVSIVFHGFLSREAVFDIYRQSDVFIMPTTASEGFPKVIAEAMNFGCIPLVSNVSSIGQYVINGYNGFVISSEITTPHIVSNLKQILYLSSSERQTLLFHGREVVSKFTFRHYNTRILNSIINYNS